MSNHFQLGIFTAVLAAMAMLVTSNKLVHSRSIGSPNTTKSWIAYLKYSLQKDLYNKRDNIVYNIVQYIQEIREPIRYMINWCEPPDYTAIWLGAHLQFWAPCGYGAINIYNHNKHYKMPCLHIKINRIFYLHIRFLIFELGDSGEACLHTKLQLMRTKRVTIKLLKWVTFANFCGYREPWNVTVHFNKIALCISYANTYRLSNVSFKYISINRAFVLLHMLELNTTYIEVPTFSKMRIIYKANTAHKWMVKVDIGCVQRFEYLELFGAINYLKLFDGIKEWFPLMVIDHATNGIYVRESRQLYLNITTLYFESHVLLDNAIPGTNKSMSMSLTFRMLKATIKHLTDTNMLRIKSQGKIFQLTLSLDPIDGNFSTIYFKIRQFKGFNWGGCHHIIQMLYTLFNNNTVVNITWKP